MDGTISFKSIITDLYDVSSVSTSEHYVSSQFTTFQPATIGIESTIYGSRTTNQTETDSNFTESNDFTDNGWTKDVCITTTEFSLVINIIAICLGLIIILGNLLVLFVLFWYPSKRFMPFNWLLCHLAIADFAIGVTVFWWYGVAEVIGIPVTSMQKVVFYGISIVAVLASVEGLMAIALDRYFLILQQQKYSTTFTRKRLGIALLLMWLVPMILQIIAPALGWSCVDKCDCRIQNEFPDAVYCFGEECSQILPPLTKQQLFIASIASFIFFVVTLSLYIVIFQGVRKQSKKLKRHNSLGRSGSESSTKTSPRKVASEESKLPYPGDDAPRKRNKIEWRNNLTTVDEQLPEDLHKSLRFSTFNKTLEFPAETRSNSKSSDKSPCESSNSVFSQQESNATAVTELSLSPDRSDQPTFDDASLVIYNKNAFPRQQSHDSDNVYQSGSGTIVLMRPRTPNYQRQASNDSRKSVRQSVVRTFNRWTGGRGRRRTSASRKRDLKVMRSMFIIMTVFVVTTAPLMIFIIYTFFNNDRKSKETFNYLLQITTLNSLLNPFLYFLRIPHMRLKLIQLVRARYWQNKWRSATARCRKQPAQIKPARAEVSELSWESGASDSIIKE